MPLQLLLLPLALPQPPPRRVALQQRDAAEAQNPVNPFLPTVSVRAGAQIVDANFRAYPALNDDATRMAVNAGRRHRLHLKDTDGSEEVDPTVELFSDGGEPVIRHKVVRYISLGTNECSSCVGSRYR